MKPVFGLEGAPEIFAVFGGRRIWLSPFTRTKSFRLEAQFFIEMQRGRYTLHGMCSGCRFGACNESLASYLRSLPTLEGILCTL